MTEEDLNQTSSQTEKEQKKQSEKSIEEITGKSASTVSDETREILELYDALQSDDPTKINKEKRDTDIKKIKELQEKIAQNPTLAASLAHYGFGSEQLNITSDKLTDRVDEVGKEMENPNGEISEAEEMLEKTKEKNPQLSETNIENLSKEELGKYTGQELFSTNNNETQKNNHLSLLKNLSEKGKKFLAQKNIRNFFKNKNKSK